MSKNLQKNLARKKSDHICVFNVSSELREHLFLQLLLLKCDKDNLMKSLFLICLGRILYLRTNISTSLTKMGLTGKQNSEK